MAALTAAIVGIPGIAELIRRRKRRAEFHSTGVIRIAPGRSVSISDVKEIRAESFQEHDGVAIVVALRNGDEITVTGFECHGYLSLRGAPFPRARGVLSRRSSARAAALESRHAENRARLYAGALMTTRLSRRL